MGHGARPNDPDRELIRRIAVRDRQASSALFDRYGQEIFAFLARRAGRAESEDLLQEVFVRALRAASNFRGDASVRTWLYSIARHTLLERRRSRIDAETLAEMRDDRREPESAAIAAEQRRRVVAALERLPDEQAIVLELFHVDGLSHGEIAQILGIRRAACRKRLQRATRAFERALGVAGWAGFRHAQLESWRESLLRRAVPMGADGAGP